MGVTRSASGPADLGAARVRAAGVARPPIERRFIPITAKRRAETRAYARRHYGTGIVDIRRPKVIVEHLTETADFGSVYNTFAADVPDVELHELPGVCSQFVIDGDGTVNQLTPVRFMCRHTVGLNYAAIGIEHVGYTDSDVLDDRRQLRASLALTRWLRCRYGIPVRDVIGHSESVGSPYHHELVPGLRTQTHADWQAADMETYRARLAAAGGCARGG